MRNWSGTPGIKGIELERTACFLYITAPDPGKSLFSFVRNEEVCI